MDKIQKLVSLYLATLRAIGLIHLNNHWLAKGVASYGDHLLFERIYNSAQKDADLAAEKFVCIFGDEILKYSEHFALLQNVLNQYKNKIGVDLSLSIETDFLKLSEDVYNELEKENKLSLGTDDMLMAISSSREEAIYLLTRKND